MARAHGLRTAWSDKHAAYEILNGPAGTDIQDLFTPEINSVADNAGDDWTTDNALIREYDSTTVAAVLNEIGGLDHSGTRHVGTPAIFGMNFQSVSTAEKLPRSDSLSGGYLADGTPGPPLLRRALDYVNAQLAAMTRRIARDSLAASTTIILSAKHGQSPKNPAALRRVDDGAIIDAINAGWATTHPTAAPLVAFSVDDDAMLLWLSDRSAAALAYAKHYLLTDLIGIAQHGVVYTGGVKKISEHGGASPEDRHVPIIVAGAGVPHHATSTANVLITQIAPTILRLLRLNPQALQAVQTEHTRALPHT